MARTAVLSSMSRRCISSSALPKASIALFTRESRHTHYNQLTAKTLRSLLAAQDLKTTGSKSQLIERLASHDTFVRSASTTAVTPASAQFLPAIVPKPWDLAPPVVEAPIRVPFLPDNDFARYHRREFVPTVAEPHIPIVSVLSESESPMDDVGSRGLVARAAKEIVDTMFPPARTIEGAGVGFMVDPGEPLTEEKKQALKYFAVGSAVWYVMGSGIMSTFGIL